MLVNYSTHPPFAALLNPTALDAGSRLPSWLPIAGATAPHDYADFGAQRYWTGRSYATFGAWEARSGISFDRDGTAYELIGGAWSSFAGDEPRRSAAGLHIEPAGTNYAPNSLSAGPPSGTTPPTGVAVINARGLSLAYAPAVKDGIPGYTIRVYGTATSSGGVVFNIIPTNTSPANYATTGESYRGSVFLARTASVGPVALGGTTKFNVLGLSNTGSTVEGSTSSAVTITSDLARYELQRSLVGASVRIGLQFSPGDAVSGSAHDVTYFVGLPQIEKATRTSSPIASAVGATGVRPAELLANDDAGFDTDTGATLLITATAPSYSVESVLAQADDGTEDNRIRIVRDSSGILRVIVTVGGDAELNFSTGALANGADATIAVCIAGDEVTIGRDAGSVFAVQTIAANPGVLDNLRLGSGVSGPTGDIAIKRFAYYDRDLSGADVLKISGFDQATFEAELTAQIEDAVPAPTMAVSPTLTVGASSAAATLTGSAIAKDDAGLRFLGGAPELTGTTSPRFNYISCNCKTREDGTREGGVAAVEFVWEGVKLELRVYRAGSSFDIYVGGELSANPHIEAAADGTQRWVLIDFTALSASPVLRHIRIEFRSRGAFGGLTLDSGGVLHALDSPKPKRLLVLGDSFTEGTGATNVATGFAPQLARKLGFSDFWISGMGGTGYIRENDDVTPARPALVDRIDTDILPANADMFAIFMGLNDPTTAIGGKTIEDALNEILDVIALNRPMATTLVYSCWNPNEATIPLNAPKDDMMEAACAGRPRVHYIYAGDIVFTKSDSTHPDQAGHDTIADDLEEPTKAALGVD